MGQKIERMERDSNPRNPCEFAGFQNRCLKPLSHPSVEQIKVREELPSITISYFERKSCLKLHLGSYEPSEMAKNRPDRDPLQRNSGVAPNHLGESVVSGCGITLVAVEDRWDVFCDWDNRTT